MAWMQGCFGVLKPVIGMCHLPALPGDPAYDPGLGMKGIVAHALREIESLQEGEVDGILISNEFSLPYLTQTEAITAIAMTKVIAELGDRIRVPFGVDVLWDGRASVDVAAVTGAAFVREIFTGVYASDFGLWDTNIGSVARHRRNIGAQGVKLIFNIVPEAAVYLATRDLSSIVRSTVFNALPDGLCISGVTAGSAADVEELRAAKAAAGATPVIVNTGVTDENVAELLGVCDGAIVGTFFKENGVFERRVDHERIAKFMSVVRGLREK